MSKIVSDEQSLQLQRTVDELRAVAGNADLLKVTIVLGRIRDELRDELGSRLEKNGIPYDERLSSEDVPSDILHIREALQKVGELISWWCPLPYVSRGQRAEMIDSVAEVLQRQVDADQGVCSEA